MSILFFSSLSKQNFAFQEILSLSILFLIYFLRKPVVRMSSFYSWPRSYFCHEFYGVKSSLIALLSFSNIWSNGRHYQCQINRKLYKCMTFNDIISEKSNRKINKDLIINAMYPDTFHKITIAYLSKIIKVKTRITRWRKKNIVWLV